MHHIMEQSYYKMEHYSSNFFLDRPIRIREGRGNMGSGPTLFGRFAVRTTADLALAIEAGAVTAVDLASHPLSLAIGRTFW